MRFVKGLLAPIVYLSSNVISLVGVVLVTSATVLWLVLLPRFLSGEPGNAYEGIVQFMILPGVFFGGLALIPLGIYWYKKGHRDTLPAAFPELDLRNDRFRKLLLFIGLTTVANVIIGGQLSYRAVAYMETPTFCGQTCHTVMKPEFTAYQNSPHARVACVSCHIGPGANWFVKSKLSGAWQVVSVTFNLYQRPIPVPVKALRPARETCEVCHWPQKFAGNRIRVIDKFTDDEQPKHPETVLMMKIGGGGSYDGIHGAHMGPGVHITYATADPKRQTIPWVRYERNGEATTFRSDGLKEAALARMEHRTMDCIDCHTRPSHSYQLPERAIDARIASGAIDPTLPYVRKTALEIIKAAYPTTPDSERLIPRRFREFYQNNYPALWQSRQAAIERAAQAVLQAFSQNVFPEMRVRWGAYANNIGHTDYPGCFRCHDERAGDKGARTIPQDCNTCHQLLAMEEESPKILADLGLAPAPAGGK
jgi:nitrate/TMAO reductase-like tetraheme cytochrome c subunit